MPPDFIVRDATPDDAEALNQHRRRIANEPGNKHHMDTRRIPAHTRRGTRPDHPSWTQMPTARMLLAIANGGIIGLSSVIGVSQRKATQHVVGLGNDVAKEWRGRGVGTAMMRELVEWSRQHPQIVRLELEVFTRNATAIHLYKKLGFIEEGIRRKAYFKEGVYLDSLMMAILFEK